MKVQSRAVKAGDQSGNSLRGSDPVDSSQMEKQRLKNQIHELATLISQIEANLGITKFGDVEKKTESTLTLTLDRRTSKRVPNTNVLFRKEIHKYIGFYCAKANKTEYILNYKPYNKIGPNDTFSVQICNKDGKAILGNWVMPMSIDINKILSETPIEDLSTVVPFLKNWKLYIDCYTERKLQFYELKESIFDSSNCTIDANASFTLITLWFFGLYNKAKDSYIDLTVYLSYKPNETRPCKINMEHSLKKCSPTEENELKSYTKFLKNHSISEGFGLMMETTHPVFSWTAEKHDDSPLELNNTSDSDEELILERVNHSRKKSMKKRRKRHESNERSKRIKGKNKSERSQPGVSVDEENAHSSYETRLSSQRTRNTSELPLQFRESNKNTVNELPQKPRRELRQTTINFRSNKISKASNEDSRITEANEVPTANTKRSVKINNSKHVDKTIKKSALTKKQTPLVGILSAKKKDTKRINRAVTSTPLRKVIASKVKFVPMTDEEISPIVSTDEKEYE